jgi:hypothetical protein
MVGCSVKRPDGVIDDATMEGLLYDYYIAKSMGDNLQGNENYKKELYTDAVFKKYGTTKAVFDSSLVWYARNTQTLSKIYDKVSERLKRQQLTVNKLVSLRDKKPGITMRGDSVDVWPWLRILRLTGEMEDNKYAFSIPVDTNYQDRDTLVWMVDYHFLRPLLPDSLRRVVMAMQVLYDKDTLSRVETVSASGPRRLSLYADTLGAMKEIRGFIYYSRPDSLSSGPLLGINFQLMRYHCKDSLTFAQRDSLNRGDTLRADSLAKDVPAVKAKADSAVKETVPAEERRLTPEEMNRRRTTGPREKRPEQIEVEQHIRQEQLEQEQLQRRNQQRRQQPRRPETRPQAPRPRTDNSNTPQR